MDASEPARAWLERHTAEDFCYLTTTGRRSGKKHTIEIWFAVDLEDPAKSTALYMMAGGRDRSDWVRNLMKTPEVTVRIREHTRPGHARVLDAALEPVLDTRVRRLLAAKYQEWSPDGSLSEWAQTALPVEVRFP